MKKLVLTSAVLCSSFLSADGIGINLGPIDVGIGVDRGSSYDDGYYYQERPAYGPNYRPMAQAYGNPNQMEGLLCQAITNQNQIEIVVEKREVVNAKEAKIVTKKVVVEPYGLAATQDGQPVLRGNIVSGKNIKEMIIKFDEDHFKTDEKKEEKSSSWFSSAKVANLDISNVSSVNVINNSHFDVPKDYTGFNDDSLFVICEIPVVKK